MQFQNSDEQYRKRLIIGAMAATLLIIGVAAYGLTHQKKRGPQTGTSESYYDPGSGETVSNPAGKSPEIYGTGDASEPVFLGFSKLLDTGMTIEQVASVQKAFSNYGAFSKQKITDVSVTVATIERQGPTREDPKDVVTFDVVINRTTTLKSRVEAVSLDVSRLYLTDGSNKQVFDSFNDVAGPEDAD